MRSWGLALAELMASRLPRAAVIVSFVALIVGCSSLCVLAACASSPRAAPSSGRRARRFALRCAPDYDPAALPGHRPVGVRSPAMAGFALTCKRGAARTHEP